MDQASTSTAFHDTVNKNKWCVVKLCKNTAKNAPTKLFITGPALAQKTRRELWLKACGRDLNRTSVFFVCEDHFNLEEDMANLVKYKLGATKKIVIKPDVVPHIFEYEQNHKKPLQQTEETATKLHILEEVLQSTIKKDDTKLKEVDATMMMQMQKTDLRHKYCVVELCKNTSKNSPTKLFITGPPPYQKTRRELWLKACGRDFKCASVFFVCEDHFNLEEDMANPIKYKLGATKKIEIKPDVVPHIFEYQQNHKRPVQQTQEAATKLHILDNYNNDTTINIDDSTITMHQYDAAIKEGQATIKKLTMDVDFAEPKSVTLNKAAMVRSSYRLILPKPKVWQKLAGLSSDNCKWQPDNKTEPLFMEIEEEQEVDFASLSTLPEISVKSLLKPRANDIKTEISPEIDVTDYSISNIDTVKTEQTNVENDRNEMSCDDFAQDVKVEIDLDSSTNTADSTTTIKSETSVIQERTSSDSAHKTDIMVPIKDELEDYASISYHDDFNQIKFEKNTSNIEKIICKICETYFSDWISLAHHLEDCYERVCNVSGQTFTSTETLDEHALPNESRSTYTKMALKERNSQDIISEKIRGHKCRFCKISYKFPAELRYHIMTHTTVKHYLCSYCGNNFNLSRRSKCKRTHSLHSHTHITKKTDNKASDSLKIERRYNCSACKKSYRQQKYFINHKCIITNETSHNSSQCSKRSVIASDLGRHARTQTGEKLYVCSHCNKSFTKRSNLTEHVRTHTGEKPFECPHCSNRFAHLSTLNKHKLTHTGKGSYECSDCSWRYTNSSDLTKHKRIHNSENPYDCSHCSKSFTKRSHLEKHLRTHTGLKPYKCSHCSKCFTTQSVLTAHIRIHTGEKPYECSYCCECFTQKRYLISHERAHTGEKPYECPDCNKGFPNQRNLTRHRRIHTGEKPYECSDCSKCFTTQRVLTVHIRTHTGEKPYECSDCSSRYTNLSDLTRHKRIHTGEKPYECSHCSKRFTYQSELTVHIRMHTGEKPYDCPHCSKRFTSQRVLTEHIRTHTGEKPYECSHCGKCFTQKGQLTIHKRYHTGEKPFECSDCSKRFTTSGDLNSHKRIHTGEKPYECLHCKKRFTTQRDRTTHMRTHTGEKPYECPDCSKRFTVLCSLNRHKLTHTANNFRNVIQ